MVAMGFCRPCMASLGQQDSIAGHQTQVPLFLHIFQKVEQNNLHHTSSEDASAPASLIPSVSGHDSYAKSTSAKRITQQFAPRLSSSRHNSCEDPPAPESLPDSATQCDIIENSTIAESSFKRITDTYMWPSLAGYPTHRKNGDALFCPALANDALADASSGAFMAKDILDASLSYAGLNNGVVCANQVSVDETTHGAWAKDRAYIRKQEIEAAPDTGFCVSSNSDRFYPSPVKVASDGNYSIQGEVADDTIHKSFSAVKKMHDMYDAFTANDEREVTHDTGLMKMADTEPGFYNDRSAKVLTTNSLSHVCTPRMTRYVQSLENHQAEDFETASIEENLFVSDIEKNGGLESRSCSPGTSHSWQDLWHFEEENSDNLTAPFTFESDNGDVINAVLDIAKHLPKNETLQDHLHPYSGRIDHLCGNAILYKLQKEGLFVSAFYLFEWMRLHTPCLLTSRSLCTIFTVSGEANMVDWALVLFNNLRHSKKLWFVQVFNALLSALSKHRRAIPRYHSQFCCPFCRS